MRQSESESRLTIEGSVCLSISLYWCSVSCFKWGGALDDYDLLLSYHTMTISIAYRISALY